MKYLLILTFMVTFTLVLIICQQLQPLILTTEITPESTFFSNEDSEKLVSLNIYKVLAVALIVSLLSVLLVYKIRLNKKDII